MKKHFFIFFILLSFLSFTIYQPIRTGKYKSSYSLKDGESLSLDTVISFSDASNLIPEEDFPKMNSAILRAFDKDNFSIIDIYKFVNYVISNHKIGYWNIKSQNWNTPPNYLDWERGIIFSDYYHKIFQNSTARSILTKYSIDLLTKLCNKYPSDFKNEILVELDQLLIFSYNLNSINEIDLNESNSFWEGFIFRRYKTDGVPTAEIQKALLDAKEKILALDVSKQPTALYEIGINNQIIIFYDIESIDIISTTSEKVISLMSGTFIKSIKNLVDETGEYYLFEGYKNDESCSYLFDSKLNVIFAKVDDAISPIYTVNGNLNFFEKPEIDSRVIHKCNAGDSIAIVNESSENWNYFYVKTKSNIYGYTLKSMFDNNSIDIYSTKEYLKWSNALKLGYCKFRQSDYQGAINDYTKAIDISPKYSDAYVFRGNAKAALQDFQGSIVDYSLSIGLNSKSKEAYFYRGISNELLKNNINALMDYTKCIEIDSVDIVAYFRRGLVKSVLNDRIGAIKDYDFIIDYEYPQKEKLVDMATVFNNKGYCLVELGKYLEAVPFVEKALLLDKTKGYIWDTSGELNYNLGNYNKCIKDMDQAIQISSGDNSFYYRGLAKIKLGLKNDGCIDLNKAKELGKSEALLKINELCN